MGSWTEEIFGSDLACDVRDEYREHIDVGNDAETAATKVKKAFAEQMRDADDKRTIWIALAATQLESGEVIDSVRTAALKAVAWCEHPDRDPAQYPFALAELAVFREKLGGKPRKTIKKPTPKSKVSLGEKGDVLAVKLPNNGGEAVIYGVGSVRKDRSPGYKRWVLLTDLPVEAANPCSVRQALSLWRVHRQYWPNGPGRSIGCYDVNGILPASKTRLLLNGIEPPIEFERRMLGCGAVHRSAELPWVLEHDLGEWKRCKWVMMPDDPPDEA